MAARPTPVPKPRAWKRRLLRLGASVLVLYGVLLVIFKSLENSLVYHPTTAAEGWLAPPSERVEDVRMTMPTGEDIHGWWLPTDDPKPTGAILICHGNGGNLSHRGRMMADLTNATGLPVLIFDYPGYGKSTGKPSEGGCYDAGTAAVKWLFDKGIPTANVVLVGESLGGGVATELATKLTPRALVLVKMFTSLPAAAKWHYRWLPTHTLMSNRFDTLSKLPKLTCPVFIAHGTADRVVPFKHAEELFAAANEPKRFLRLEGQDHNAWLTADFHQGLAEFLKATR